MADTYCSTNNSANNLTEIFQYANIENICCANNNQQLSAVQNNHTINILHYSAFSYHTIRSSNISSLIDNSYVLFTQTTIHKISDQ